MIRLIWAVLCSKSVLDSSSNNVSLFDVVEQIGIDKKAIDDLPQGKLPMIPIQLELVALWERENPEEAKKGKSRTLLRGPDGGMVIEESRIPIAEIDTETTVRSRLITKILGFPFKGFGRYVFMVQELTNSGEWKTRAEVPVEIKAT